MRIWIKNAAIVPMTAYEDIMPCGQIYLENNRILAVGDEIPDFEADKMIDAKGMIAMPGLINAHTHLGMSLFRNYADDMPLEEWLEDKCWPLEAKLTDEDIYIASLLSMAELISTGTTTFVDMYYEMHRVAQAALEIGIRGVLTRGITDGDKMEDKFIEVEKLIQDWHDAHGMLMVMTAPHAVYTCSPETIRRLSHLAHQYRLGLHTHANETETETRNALDQYGLTPIGHLAQCGAFDVPAIAAHCVTANAQDIRILKEKGVSVVHNPSSNMKLASGLAPIQEMLDAGVNVCLGTDGPASNNMLDMFMEMREASLIAKVRTLNPTLLPAYTVLEMATVNGAKAIGRDDLGKLAPGMTADLILIDRKGIHHSPYNNLYSELVYSTHGTDVSTVIIDGEIVMQDKVFENIDIDLIQSKAESAFQALLKR